MAYILSVIIPDYEPLEFPLENGRYQLGSDGQCELAVDFDEVADRAAQVEVRGEAVFLRNLNSFTIYVGEQELRSNEQTEWPVGQKVLLTTNVSLAIHNDARPGLSGDASAADAKNRSTVQIAVVCGCAILGLVLLSGDGGNSQESTTQLAFGFTELVEKWSAVAGRTDEQKRRQRTVLNYLIDARVSDIRWGKDNPARAIAAYELLLDSPLIEQSRGAPGSPEVQIRTYALARVNDLSSRLSPEP